MNDVAFTWERELSVGRGKTVAGQARQGVQYHTEQVRYAVQ